MKKRIIKCFVISILILSISIVSIIPVFAHPERLNVVYDACVPDENDGLDEMWYNLEAPNSNTPYLCQHLDHQITTLKYIFSEYGEDGITTWDTGSDENMGLTIKTIVAESIKKWNNVYFYSYDVIGNIIKCKIINIVETDDENSANLIIYPSMKNSSFATFKAINDVDPVGEERTNHHFSKCQITIFLPNFISDIQNISTGTLASERAATHEIGHVLGLVDIDSSNYCGSSDTSYHHQELLMGYSSSGKLASAEITYKDIAGVAIARGFHTDNDHKWLKMEEVYTDVNKLVCSICNGVVYQHESSGYTYDIYGRCNNEHGLSSGNMMAVASYGNKDYYKCKYCRYVAPFENLIEQNYSNNKTNYSSDYHLCENVVSGLVYDFYEAHNLVNHECTECDYNNHSYTDHYEKHNAAGHYAYCSCGDRIEQAHVLMRPVGGSVGGLSICKYCGASVSFGVLDSIPSDYPHTENGSYILPSGIIVLVPEDEEAYLNGTLEFRTGEIM